MKALPLLAVFLGLAAAPVSHAATMAVTVGDPALLFTLPAINEDAAVAAVGTSRVSLGDFAGVTPPRPAKATVVHFFDKGSGDGAQLAALERLKRRHGGKGLQVLAVTDDDGDLGSLSTWIEDQKLSFPVLRDNHRVVLSRYRIDKLPLTLLVDADGRVFAIGNPQGEALELELEGEITALLSR